MQPTGTAQETNILVPQGSREVLLDTSTVMYVKQTLLPFKEIHTTQLGQMGALLVSSKVLQAHQALQALK